VPDKEFFKYLDKYKNERLRISIKLLKGNVVDIVVQYESFINNNWTPIVRYDCAHGFFHRDLLNPDGSQEKQAIAIEKLEDALRYAEQDLTDRWKYYKKRFLRKSK